MSASDLKTTSRGVPGRQNLNLKTGNKHVLIALMFCNQLAVERTKSDDVQSASTTKKKKRKRDRDASNKSDTVVVAKADTNAMSDAVKVEVEFVPHDYGKANLTSLLQGTRVLSVSQLRYFCTDTW